MADIQYTSVNELDDASTLDGSEALHGVQSGNDVKITPAQIKEYFGVGLAVRSADCETEATTEIKEVTISDYEPTENDIVAITFDYANSWGDTTASTVSYPKLRIDDSYDFNICDSRGNPAGKGCWKAGDTIEFRLRGNKAIILTSDVRQVNTDGTVIMSDGTTYYNKQSVDEMKSYKKNDVISLDNTEILLSGCITGSTQSCYFNIHFDKDIPANCTLTLTKCIGAIRGIKGYVNGCSNSTDWLSASDMTTNLYRISERIYSFRIQKSSAMTNVDNNTPVNFYGKLAFKVS